ncbi:hypothetical protein [Rhizobium sp. CSW-27]|uniref:hypothetical protein n=1 Tax=Rhizobium sp. CSW-27 TaxID=2839985 RepID=UPI001C029E19|nr:hypothetical protein [Rhizobium sp. CSW-27]MBT9370980.1 hypothetical protein [Rhizobium sp. CSW-27]
MGDTGSFAAPLKTYGEKKMATLQLSFANDSQAQAQQWLGLYVFNGALIGQLQAPLAAGQNFEFTLQNVDMASVFPIIIAVPGTNLVRVTTMRYDGHNWVLDNAPNNVQLLGLLANTTYTLVIESSTLQ